MDDKYVFRSVELLSPDFDDRFKHTLGIDFVDELQDLDAVSWPQILQSGITFLFFAWRLWRPAGPWCDVALWGGWNGNQFVEEDRGGPPKTSFVNNQPQWTPIGHILGHILGH